MTVPPQSRPYPANPTLTWLKCNFHAHANSRLLRDEGPSIEDAANDYRAAGYDLLFHSPHSDYTAPDAASAELPGTYEDALRKWQEEKHYEEKILSDKRLLISTGEELELEGVPDHPESGDTSHQHLGLVGMSLWVPHHIGFKAGCEMTHAGGGVVIVNHPFVWGTDFSFALAQEYYGRPGLLDKYDAVEVFNGSRLLEDFAMYRQMISPSQGGQRLAAIAGVDSHRVGVINAYTMVGVASSEFNGNGAGERRSSGAEEKSAIRNPQSAIRAVVEAIRQRRTYAVGYNRQLTQEGIRLRVPHLGQVINSSEVKLNLEVISFPKNTALEITLYRDKERVKRWTSQGLRVKGLGLKSQPTTLGVSFHERINQPAVYSFQVRARTTKGRSAAVAYTSGIWFDPTPERLPDLTIRPEDITLSPGRGGTVIAITLNVRNAGAQNADNVKVAVHEGFPYLKGGRLVGTTVVPTVPANGSARATLHWHPRHDGSRLIYVKVDPESYDYDRDDDAVEELDEKNNQAIKVWE